MIVKAAPSPALLSVSSYQFLHKGMRRGNNYYRLMIEEADGSISFSNAALVNAAYLSRGALTASPNPTNGLLTITGLLREDQVSLLRPVGKVLLREVCAGDGGTSLNLADLPAGIYLLKVQDKGGNVIGVLWVERL